MKFLKMHGTGNDYIFFDCIKNSMPEKPELFSIKVCNRHFGIGGDGVAFVLPSTVANFKMRIFNPDGSEAEMCGNAIRCLGKFLYEKKQVSQKIIYIETIAGIKRIVVNTNENKVSTVSVDMGAPVFEFSIGKTESEKAIIKNYPIEIHDKIFHFTPVSMGNPHAVIFVSNVENFEVENYGKIIESYSFFPKRTNVEFVEILDRKNIKLRVFERGVGETLSCGTGASASVVACVLNNLTDNDVSVHLRGGKLFVKWDENVFLTGEATSVFSGECFSF